MEEIDVADQKEPAGFRAPPTPRWVKALAIGAVVVVLVVVVVMVVVGGGHGPWQHGG